MHPEDAAIYVAEFRSDLAKIAVMLERIAVVLEECTNPDGEPVRVAQSGAWNATSYMVQP